MFIIWLCWLFRFWNGDRELEVHTATYGPGIDQSQHAKSVSHIINLFISEVCFTMPSVLWEYLQLFSLCIFIIVHVYELLELLRCLFSSELSHDRIRNRSCARLKINTEHLVSVTSSEIRNSRQHMVFFSHRPYFNRFSTWCQLRMSTKKI